MTCDCGSTSQGTQMGLRLLRKPCANCSFERQRHNGVYQGQSFGALAHIHRLRAKSQHVNADRLKILRNQVTQSDAAQIGHTPGAPRLNSSRITAAAMLARPAGAAGDAVPPSWTANSMNCGTALKLAPGKQCAVALTRRSCCAIDAPRLPFNLNAKARQQSMPLGSTHPAGVSAAQAGHQGGVALGLACIDDVQ